MDQSSITELTIILRKWEEEVQSPSFNPTTTLNKLCDIFEAETKIYLKKDPDPFDNRHPSRIDPTCVLGQMYKILFRKDVLMNCLVMDYLKDSHWARRPKDNIELNVAACRLIMSLIPGLETTVVFESPTNDELINRLFTWAQSKNEPLQTYATGLLAACMELPDIAANFKEENNILVPKVLDRLHLCYNQFYEEIENNQNSKPLLHLNNGQAKSDNNLIKPSPKKKIRHKTKSTHKSGTSGATVEDSVRNSKKVVDKLPKETKENSNCVDSNSSCVTSDNITSSWVQIYPLTLTTKVVYCLKYLIPTGEYQEFLSHAFEKNALNLVMKIISTSDKQNGYMTFEALKYLASLLCHKKFATEFISISGLQKILLIPKPSIPSTGVSICFYYLSYCEEAMERICLLPEHVLTDLVMYALWMLECSHDSSRCHATMFFSYSFHFRIIQEIFDNHDGLRKLINVVSTLPTLSSNNVDYSTLSEDAECSARQIIRHVCAGLKHYFEAHLHIKAHQIRRSKMKDSGLLSSSTVNNDFSIPAYKSTKKSQAEVYEEIELLANVVSAKSHWTPIDNLIKLGGINLLVRVISMAHDWNVAGRCEMIKNALEVVNICAVLPKVQLMLCEPAPKIPEDTQPSDVSMMEMEMQSENDNVGLNVIIKAAEGDLLDADIQKAALFAIITCVCFPIPGEGVSLAYYSTFGTAKKRPHKLNDDAVIEKVWDCIRKNNGIMVLLNLMTIKTPITDVDALRGLASRALAGLARSESVRQIISKLPLFNNGQLQTLMKNPVLQEKRQEHVAFQKYALELMELVCGKTNGAEIEESLANINRANIVAQTKIHYNEQQLLHLMHQHFITKGLNKTAEILAQEANLNVADKKSVPIPYVAHCRNRSIGGVTPVNSRHSTQIPKSDLASTSNSLMNNSFGIRGINSSSPMRLSVNRRSEIRPKPEPEFESPMSKSVHKKIDQDMPLPSDNNGSSTVSIDSIVTEYLTNQHASCKHPMVTCPQFNLFVPHKCPDPKPRNLMITNFAMRFSKNIHSRRLDQRLIHSRFCSTTMFHMDQDDDEAYFTCTEFISPDRVAVGTYSGDIKIFNILTSQEDLSFSGHDSYINNLECSNNGRLLLSSASWRTPLTSLWTIDNDTFTLKYSLDLEEFCSFSNRCQNKLLGTKAEVATIYDIETCTKILSLVPKHSNQYSRNRAVFDPTNELVLSDGVLWDATSKREIHKFDKLNQNVSGIFHPNGLEIVSNTEVWDMRTFQLLRTVPSLDQCSVLFSKSGDGMYVYVIDQETDDDSHYQTSFNTLDPYDYSSIATIDVKKCIYHMATNKYDTQIAIVENQGIYDNIDESVVRIYDVGRSRADCDNAEEEEEDDEDVDSEGSDSDNLSHLFPSLLDDLMNGGPAAVENNVDGGHFQSSSSNSSVVSVHSPSASPLSDSSNDASYDANVNTDPEDIGA